jgi:plasmid stabilization system protein ParE
MKTPKTYKFSDITLSRIEDIQTWLPAQSATHAIEEALAEFHNRLKLRQQLGDFQAELAELWQRFEQHPHYGVYTKSDGSERMYNIRQDRKWNATQGVFALTVLKRFEGRYNTAYSTYQLTELADSEKWFVP